MEALGFKLRFQFVKYELPKGMTLHSIVKQQKIGIHVPGEGIRMKKLVNLYT